MKSILTFLLIILSTASAMASGKLVTYNVNDATYEGYFISPSPEAPLVLLIHDWDGLTDYEIKRSNMLVELGYSVFAADLFGIGIRPTEVKDKRQHTGELYKDRDKLRTLLNSALETARKLGADTGNAVAMGYCFGGAAVLELARSGAELKGFVTFHGGLATPEGQDHSMTKGQLLVFHGSADTAITMEDFSGLAKELEQYGVAHEMIAYGGAPHAFTVFGSKRYRKDADQKSWARFSTYLAEVLR